MKKAAKSDTFPHIPPTSDRPRPGKRATPSPASHQHLVDWLNTHPLISRRGLQLAVGMTSNDLYKSLKGEAKLPAKYYPLLTAILTTYGYKPL